MAAIVFPVAMPPQPVATQAVSMRATWDGPWLPVPLLHCTQLALATGESLSAATFLYGVGQYLPPGGTTWTAQPVLSINPQTYVRVQVTAQCPEVSGAESMTVDVSGRVLDTADIVTMLRSKLGALDRWTGDYR
jgi:hypothetical protein